MNQEMLCPNCDMADEAGFELVEKTLTDEPELLEEPPDTEGRDKHRKKKDNKDKS